MKLSQIAAVIGAEFCGADFEINDVATLENACKGTISFYHNRKYAENLLTTKASAVVMRKIDYKPEFACGAIFSANPHDDFRKIVLLFHPPKPLEIGISSQASVHETAHIAENCRIDAFALISKDANIKAGTHIGAGVFIGERVTIGTDCTIYPHVVIYDGCTIGNGTIIPSGAVIGADGFGYSQNAGIWHKMPQIGAVVIGNNVEIGANTTVDRGAIDNTVIGDGTKIDNLCQIAHNVVIGKNCAFAAQVGISGSTTIGDNVQIGGQAGLTGHIEISDGVIIMAQSGGDSTVPAKSIILGAPARDHRETFRQMAAVAELPELMKKLKKLLPT